jgi:hypothetical protein
MTSGSTNHLLSDRGDKGDQQQAGDHGEGFAGGTEIGGDGFSFDVVHAEETGKGQRDQQQQPDVAGVVDKSLGAGRDLADQGAAGVDQGLRFPAEQAEGHHQGNQDLHGGDAEVAEPGVQSQGGPLDPLGEEEADVRHGGGEVAAAEAGE